MKTEFDLNVDAMELTLEALIKKVGYAYAGEGTESLYGTDKEILRKAVHNLQEKGYKYVHWTFKDGEQVNILITDHEITSAELAEYKDKWLKVMKQISEK